MANDWPVNLETLVPNSGSATKHVIESCVIQLPYLESEEVGVQIAKFHGLHASVIRGFPS